MVKHSRNLDFWDKLFKPIDEILEQIQKEKVEQKYFAEIEKWKYDTPSRIFYWRKNKGLEYNISLLLKKADSETVDLEELKELIQKNRETISVRLEIWGVAWKDSRNKRKYYQKKEDLNFNIRRLEIMPVDKLNIENKIKKLIKEIEKKSPNQLDKEINLNNRKNITEEIKLTNITKASHS